MDKKKKEEIKEERLHRHHKRVWSFSRTFIGPFVKAAYACECKPSGKLPEPFLLLANHSTDLDPGLIGICCKQQMYFVASEHLYRLGFLSKILYWAYQPIAKMKGSSDALTVMKTIRYLRNGKNVSLFPDGNRSFNGRGSEMTDAIGKLVKTSGANLVTFKITGGFFTNPRWGYGLRKGKMTAGVVNIYTKEQLKDMTPAQIREIVEKDTYESAYERQALENIRYVGKDKAYGMECSLCVCPKCKTIESIYTNGDSIFCKKCGKLTNYSEYGYFDEGFNFKTIEQWDDWQESFYKEYFKDVKDGKIEAGLGVTKPIFVNESVHLQTLTSNHEETDLGVGSISLYLDKLVFETSEKKLEILISDIPDISVYAKTGLVFTDAKGIHYEVKSENLINVRKYISAWNSFRKELGD